MALIGQMSTDEDQYFSTYQPNQCHQRSIKTRKMGIERRLR